MWLENEIRESPEDCLVGLKADNRTEEKEREALEKSTSELARAKALAEGGGIECGCCFTEEVWVSLIVIDFVEHTK